jgi:hypothetical protein
MNAPHMEASLGSVDSEHETHVEGFIRTLYWIFVVTSAAFIFAGMMWLL